MKFKIICIFLCIVMVATVFVVPAIASADVNVSVLAGVEGFFESEVSIDINPMNPNNLVIVGHSPDKVAMNTFWSKDGGLTWTLKELGDAQDGMTSTRRFDPTVAFDENGNVYVAYGVKEEDPDQVTVMVAKSINGGEDYIQFTPVDTAPNVDLLAGNDKWHLATGPDPSIPSQQNVYIAWTQNAAEGDPPRLDQRIVVSCSTDGGEYFSTPVIINDGSIDGYNQGNVFADPAVGPNGEVYVAWHDWSEGKVYVDVSRDRWDNFGADKEVTSSNTGVFSSIPAQPDRGVFVGPTIDADRSNSPYKGRLYVTYTDCPDGLPDTNIYVQFSDNCGDDWSDRILVNDDGGPNSQFLPWLDVDQQTGLVSVVWYDARNDPHNKQVEVFLGVSRTGGVSFQPNICVSDGQSDQSEDNPHPYSGNYLEYIGVATHNLKVHPVWSDNSIDAADLDFFTNQFSFASVDVYILVDLSGSFHDDLPIFKEQAPDIIRALSDGNPDIQFGLGKFEDYPIDPFGSETWGDKAYERLVDLIPPPLPPADLDTYEVLIEIEGLFTRNGLDLPESQLTALYQAATGEGQDLSELGYPDASIPPGQQASFRDGAIKIILLWTDSDFHNPGDEGDVPYPGPSKEETIDAILALDPPIVIGIDSSEDGAGIPDLTEIAIATGAFAPIGGVDWDSDGIIDIQKGEPLVCSVLPEGAGIGGAMIAMSKAVIKLEINEPPVADAGDPYSGYEGSPITFDASASSDLDGDSLEYRWDFNSDGNWDTGWSSDPTATYTYSDDYTEKVTIEVSDGELTDTDTASVVVSNVAPTIESIIVPTDPIKVDTDVPLTGTFTDPGIGDTHTATIDWGDETAPGDVSDHTVTAFHAYNSPGIYTITLTVTDDDDGSDTATSQQYVVIYDPVGGFVTGGGWINSPEGAYGADPSLTGKASFGFVAKYKKGMSEPTGNTEFQFKAGDLNFHSDSYEWLVIAGARAIFKGKGTINGEGDYKFMLWAVDGELPGGGGEDKFRIKIWREETEGIEDVIYDNGAESVLGGGQIVIHTKGK